MATEEFAPAKINLALHVTGRRADGYHLLDSLVVFAGVGDSVRVAFDAEPGLTIDGPMGNGLAASDDNLVLRAARFLGEENSAITLTKRLPVASGIGGGSADAAATLRAICRLRGGTLPDPATTAVLGADVPACLIGKPLRMRGIGEVLDAVPALPPAHLVLVNPGVSVSTPDVFRALERRDNPGLPPMPALKTAADLAGYLSTCRNDLEPAARKLIPSIGAVLAALEARPGCLLARMSGSGATCFGLFAEGLTATAAAAAIEQAHPGWWVAAAPILS
ncbi:4-(cytidine 5'-diphospho)-2-C-methyl-D-erythritol kinase [Defluviimonas sp. WL0075]|uniref:4-diphosphocytidyl-2-C-methyl-D-erythritol kinase n=1 Tax=Albidovulum sediminicola TaxID=2984331 RepID=A0ABT2YYF9_9RHOB|nr:4-(cytidine 5'-diphospho)-2-C-methyl-D-erythritol kinase [Defluviimonas sp. WL0075]MCV2863899.1 4-(cytidine 5'-diphospho)-2-C-methyl-D-erythritol kinase [Defluviimonas sp. WL0075]